MVDSSSWIGFCGPHTQGVKRSLTDEHDDCRNRPGGGRRGHPAFATATTQPEHPSAQCS
jgi:hypothetical protein